MLHSFNPLGDRTPRRLSAATRELAARYLSGEIGSTLRPAPQAAETNPYPGSAAAAGGGGGDGALSRRTAGRSGALAGGDLSPLPRH